jgi:hypothetical protein
MSVQNEIILYKPNDKQETVCVLKDGNDRKRVVEKSLITQLLSIHRMRNQ